MVRYRLRKAVQGVKRMRGVGCWHDPFMVWFVQSLVYQGMVQSAVDAIYEAVGKNDEEGELKDVVP